MTLTHDMLRYIIRQNELIMRQQGIAFDLASFQLERTADMADEVGTLVDDVAQETDLVKAIGMTQDHAIDLLGDLATKLQEAGTDKTKLAAIHASLVSNRNELAASKDKLAAAVVANTPFETSANT